MHVASQNSKKKGHFNETTLNKLTFNLTQKLKEKSKFNE